ncbi:MAG TPA: phosphoribosylanthranilate isomerase, partial [Candidatus Angelobacter sp.]
MHTWIKICGTTSLEDALSSIEAGANALGFIFAPSKRRITPEQAQQIINELPHEIERIGVFMNSTALEIASVVSQVSLTGIQMHGEEFAPEVYAYLPKDRRDSMRKIKTIPVRDELVL